MFDAALSPQQLQVINALSEGMNSTDAAAQAGVHPNTIANWRRNSLFFREALADAQYDRALLFRDKAEGMLDLAFATLRALLSDPATSPSVRLKAALFIINQASTPPALQKPVQPTAQPAENPPSVHKNAQNAQTAFHRDTPKVGRNAACPCGSGRKHKYCCLNKPPAAASPAAASPSAA